MIKGKELKLQGTPIILDKPRILKYNMNAYCELEDVYGTIDEAHEDMKKGSIKAIRALLYAGLVHEDDTLTVKGVGELVGSIGVLTDLINTLTNAITSSLPEANGDEAIKNQVASPM